MKFTRDPAAIFLLRFHHAFKKLHAFFFTFCLSEQQLVQKREKFFARAWNGYLILNGGFQLFACFPDLQGKLLDGNRAVHIFTTIPHAFFVPPWWELY